MAYSPLGRNTSPACFSFMALLMASEESTFHAFKFFKAAFRASSILSFSASGARGFSSVDLAVSQATRRCQNSLLEISFLAPNH